MDILEQEWAKYETDIKAEEERLMRDHAKANFELGASVVLSLYLTGELDKKKAWRIQERIIHGILAKYPDL